MKSEDLKVKIHCPRCSHQTIINTVWGNPDVLYCSSCTLEAPISEFLWIRLDSPLTLEVK